MAYNGANLYCIAETNPAGGGFRAWGYDSTTDAIATIQGAGYFSDGVTRGMKLRDVIYVRDLTTPTTTICNIKTVNAATGAVTIGTGVTVTE